LPDLRQSHAPPGQVSSRQSPGPSPRANTSPWSAPSCSRACRTGWAARSARGIRGRKHHHYLKGLLPRHSTRRLGRLPRTHLPADRLECQVEQLYEQIQLLHHWLTKLQAALRAEITIRQGSAACELQQLDRELLGLDGERRKLLAAYYADAIDLQLLRQRTSTLEARRRPLTANLDDWQAILETAGRFATNCGAAYRHADPATRKLFNNAVITASRSATATSPTSTTRRPSTCSLAGQGLNTDLWWS
jgi:hypothetical protein